MKRAVVLVTLLTGCVGTPPPVRPVVRTPSPVAAPPPRPVTEPWPAASFLVEPVSGLGLFSDEQRAAQRAIARWAMAQGIAVTPVDAVEARLDTFARGLDDEGQRCGHPLSRWSARRRYGAELGIVGKIDSSVACGEEGCFLTVRRHEGLDGDAKLAQRWTAPFTSGTSFEALTARLTPEPPSSGEGLLSVLGALGSGGGTVKARPERLVVRAWRARADHDRKALPLEIPDQTSLTRCLPPGQGTGLLIAIGPDGQAQRCEPSGSNASSARCACRALSPQLAQLELPRDTRIRVALRHDAGDVVTSDRAFVVRGSLLVYIKRDPAHETRRLPSVSHTSIGLWHPPPFSAVARCFATRSGTFDQRFLIDTFFGPRGEVLDVKFHAGGEALTAAETSCVKQAFRAATVPCPAVPKTGARVSLQIELKKIGASKPSLEDILNGPPPEELLDDAAKKN